MLISSRQMTIPNVSGTTAYVFYMLDNVDFSETDFFNSVPPTRDFPISDVDFSETDLIYSVPLRVIFRVSDVGDLLEIGS